MLASKPADRLKSHGPSVPYNLSKRAHRNMHGSLLGESKSIDRKWSEYAQRHDPVHAFSDVPFCWSTVNQNGVLYEQECHSYMNKSAISTTHG